MLRNYFRIAVRTTTKHSLYSSLNVVGLAVGMAAFLLIVAYVRFELSYDTFHEKADRTFRVVKEDAGNFYLGTNRFAVTQAGVADAMLAEIPGVESAVALDDWETLLTVDDRTFIEQGLIATASFFDVFSFELLRGDPATILTEPGAIALTPDLARRLFGDSDPIGRTFAITWFTRTYPVEVKGIVAKPPANSHLAFDFVLSMATNPRFEENKASWGNSSYYNYAVLREDADESVFLGQIGDLAHRHLQGLDWYTEDSGRRTTLLPQRLTDIHLRSHVNFEVSENGDIRYVWVAGLLAVLILLIPCTNYMNLATARAATRSREVGVRKAAGADRRQLTGQFLGEALFVAILSLLLAVGIVALSASAFNGLVARDIPVGIYTDLAALSFALLAVVLVGFVSGSYPAFVMSRPQAAAILKGESVLSGRSRLRNGLVVAQFAVGIALMFATLVIHRQMRFVATTDTGMDRARVLTVMSRDPQLSDRWDALSAELASTPGVTTVTNAAHFPTDVRNQNGIDEWEGSVEGQEMSIYTSEVGYGYLDMLDLDLIAGRDFSREFSTDPGSAVVINESAARAFGWEDPLGKHFDVCDAEDGCTVVGVVKDYHFHSLRQAIAPLALKLNPDVTSRILLKVSADDLSSTVSRVGEVWARFSPAYPYEYRFLDDAFDQLYRSDRKLADLIDAFTTLALAIACMGLFGLAAFMAQQRSKEIGVRKVLGAGVRDIVVLLSRDFTRLILIAVVIGAPASYLVVTRWLGDFAYRIEVGWGTFAAAALLAVVVGWVTVAWQSVRAAVADPVRSLRYE